MWQELGMLFSSRSGSCIYCIWYSSFTVLVYMSDQHCTCTLGGISPVNPG